MSSNLRIYDIPDSDLLQAGEMMVVALPDDIASFTAFDSTLNADYPETLRSAIDKVKSIHTDVVIVQQQAKLTADLEAAHTQCYTSFQALAYFVRKAFPNNPAIQKQFGLSEIKNAVNNQTRFIRFMEDLTETARTYKAQLLAVGCNATVIDDLPTITQTLLTADRDQEKFKKDRGLITQDRVKYLNALYLLLEPIDEVAQIIFKTDPARMAKYMLPRAVKSSATEPDPTTEPTN